MRDFRLDGFGKRAEEDAARTYRSVLIIDLLIQLEAKVRALPPEKRSAALKTISLLRELMT